MTKYLNIKTGNAVETVDELSLSDYKTYSEFRAELRRLIAEYRMAGMFVYSSSRCTKECREK